MIEIEPIGIIYTPFKTPDKAPIQPVFAGDTQGYIKVFEKYQEGLTDVAGFSHIILVYYFHLSEGYSLRVKPYLDDNLKGVFATRSPHRPNRIGISTVRLEKIENSTLYVRGVDVINETPLLDIKPYVPEFEGKVDFKIGWLKDKIKPQSEG
jgi:tRNA-Thr(GGU) m(6)t(6)A37 methyltransferase TsaA